MTHRRRAPSVPLALLLLAAARAGLAADPDLSMTVQPAWEGFAHAGATSEIGVTLLARRGGVIDVVLPGHRPPIHASVTLSANTPTTIWLPAMPEAGETLVVEARSRAGVTVRGQAAFQPLPSSFVAAFAAGSDMDPETGAGITWLRPDLASLPHTRDGYGPIDALLLDRHTVTHLDPEQTRSLEAWLAGCGRTVAIDESGDLAAELARDAGCSGRFLAVAGSAAEAGAALATLRRATPPSLPGATNLRALMNQNGDTPPWRPLAAFVAIYFMALWLLARDCRTPWAALLAPLAATGLALLAWSDGPARRQAVTWAEVAGDESVLRFAALLRLDGASAGRMVTELPADLGLPVPMPATATDGDTLVADPGILRLNGAGGLLARREYHIEGSAVSGQRPLLRMKDGRPFVVNPGPAATVTGVLGWQGRRYPVPALAPGRHWSPPDEATAWDSASTAEQILRVRSTPAAAVLLMPAPDAPFDLAPGTRHTGWVLIHAV